jgi:hypothetical protein
LLLRTRNENAKVPPPLQLAASHFKPLPCRVTIQKFNRINIHPRMSLSSSSFLVLSEKYRATTVRTIFYYYIMYKPPANSFIGKLRCDRQKKKGGGELSKAERTNERTNEERRRL